jgi:cytochrome c
MKAAWPLLALALAGCGSGSEDPRSTSQVANGERIFRRCTACHTIGQYAPDTDGPNLYGVVGGPIGERRPRFSYTAGLKALGGTWDAERMDRWLTNPRRMVPGTTMAFSGLPDPKDRADVIAYLATQGPRAYGTTVVNR